MLLSTRALTKKGRAITKKVFFKDVKGIAESITFLPAYHRSFTIVMHDQGKPKTCSRVGVIFNVKFLLLFEMTKANIQMKKQLLIPFTAVVLALVLTVGSAFTNRGENRKSTATPFYFHYTGSPGSEDDELLWEEINSTQYGTTYAGCNKAYDGCRLITENTQMDGTQRRPQLVEVDVVSGHKNPKTSVTSGVTEVGLLNNNP